MTKTKKNNIVALKAVLAQPKRGVELDDIVDLEQFGRVVDWFSPFDIHTNNNNNNFFLDRIRKLIMKGWFHGDITADEAQRKLIYMPPGSFLVRFSERTNGYYAISSIGSDNQIKHQRIQHDPVKGHQYRDQWYTQIEDIIRDASTFYIPCPGGKYSTIFDPTPIISGYVS